MIEIHPYNPQWPAEFERISAHLTQTLGPLALRIDHIGSTSVPRLGAKDIIDIQINVAALVDEIKTRMIDAGYQQFREAASDHVPDGEDPNPALWTKMLFVQGADQRRCNIHIRIAGNPNQRYPLLFRDYLRAHPKSAQTIERIKCELAKHFANDIEAYYDIKDPVYDLIWDAAQDWAKVTQWLIV